MNKLTQCIAVLTLALCTTTTMMAQEKKDAFQLCRTALGK